MTAPFGHTLALRGPAPVLVGSERSTSPQVKVVESGFLNGLRGPRPRTGRWMSGEIGDHHLPVRRTAVQAL